MISRKRLAIGIAIEIVIVFAAVFGLRAAFGPDAGWAAFVITIPCGAVIGWWIAGPS